MRPESEAATCPSRSLRNGRRGTWWLRVLAIELLVGEIHGEGRGDVPPDEGGCSARRLAYSGSSGDTKLSMPITRRGSWWMSERRLFLEGVILFRPIGVYFSLEPGERSCCQRVYIYSIQIRASSCTLPLGLLSRCIAYIHTYSTLGLDASPG